jgi:hypothetical protein
VITLAQDRQARALQDQRVREDKAWELFATKYPEFNNQAIRNVLCDPGYYNGDEITVETLEESLPFMIASKRISALGGDYIEAYQLREAEAQDEARRQRKGVLIREILGLSKEHMSETSYAFLQQKLPLMNIDELEADLKEIIERREMNGMSKEALHKGIKKVYTPIPSIRQMPADITPSVIKRMSAAQIKALNRTYGEALVNERLGVIKRAEVGSIIRGKV